ncbi:MAG TPA: ABC transporter permease [Anaerolineae bacterium]|nr:ABC transporter permease [Anaerolineae bacterium]HOR01239.1 ABC transporter permease [Anaerolineae bacterium]HOR01240.1 ABC transporter permease [Anaerolineae bacterium]HPL27142.1 ABC transporter permease [Anaerolineae bacterium]
MLQRIWAVMQKEFIHTLRDRRTLLIMLGLPLLQLVIFGYAINVTVDHIPTVVADQSLDSASRAYVDAMVASGFFDVVAYAPSQAAVVRAIDQGQATVGIVIPPGFAASVQRGDAQALILIDGADLFASQSAYGAATTIAQAHATGVMVKEASRMGRIADPSSLLPLDARIRILFNPNLKSIWFIIPGMLAMLMQTQSISVSAAAVVRERELGTIEQLLVTPIRPIELLLGKIAPNVVLTIINMLTIVAVGVFWFGVPFRGSFGLFLWLSFMYVFCGLGLGLLISTVSRSQTQAQQWVGLSMLLGTILGGFIFPRSAMPLIPRLIGNLFPLTYFISICRGIILKGVGLNVIWQDTLALFVYMVVIIISASRAFRQTLE